MEQKLWDILPKMYEYKIKYFQHSHANNFDCTFKVNVFNESKVKQWLKEFELCSYTNFRVARTTKAKQTRVIFKKYYRCHHNTRASETASKTKKAHVKHTGCEATLMITVNNSDMKKCKEPDNKQYPCVVKYHNFHNHPLTSDELLCHRKPNDRIEQKIRDLLLKNHTPVSALKILKQDLQEEFKDEYSKIVKDGAFCPKLQWIYHKYYMIFKDIYASPEVLINECEEDDDPEKVFMDFDASYSKITLLSQDNIYEECILPLPDHDDDPISRMPCDPLFTPELYVDDLSTVKVEMCDGSELSGGTEVHGEDKYICTVKLGDDVSEEHLETFLSNDECMEVHIVEDVNYDSDFKDVFDPGDKIEMDSEIFLPLVKDCTEIYEVKEP